MTDTDDGVTLTVRLIRSFEHRNVKHIVMKSVDLTRLTGDFMQFVNTELSTEPGLPPPFRKYAYDTMKIQHKAHGYKTSNPVMNTESDDVLTLDPKKTLSENGVENETEISYFKLEDYEKYKENPHTVW